VVQIKIGSISILSNTPKLIQIKNKPYILDVNSHHEPILFSAICPHQHGTVKKLEKDLWTCPSHDWIFNPKTGVCLNSPQSCLEKFSIIIKDDYLYVDIHLESNKKNISLKNSIGPKITIISNACVLFEWKNFRILTDPWIEGPAYFGSWTNYPPSNIKVKDLPPIDLIWISHEHPDHFHPRSLSLFNKNIPVMVPKLKDNRLKKSIEKLGFTNVKELESFKRHIIFQDIELISFNSGSIWNDSILFLKFGDFSTLNFNDAGLNFKINSLIKSVDMIFCNYSQGASGYPQTWTHLDDMKKKSIMTEANLGILRMIKQMVDTFKPRFVVPFAGFNELYRPEHQKYAEERKKNSLESVIDFLKDSPVKVLDLIPGESWDGGHDIINRVSNRKKFFKKEFIRNYLKNQFLLEQHLGFYPNKFTITHNEIQNYFKSFSNSDLSFKIKTLNILFCAENSQRKLQGIISFNDGKVKYIPIIGTCDVVTQMTMTCPGEIVQEIISNDLSWDEAHIGYWCTFHRNPDVYNLNLWKFLHAPWEARENSFLPLNSDLFSTSIADLIEKGGDKITKILEKFGLYCSGCYVSVGETIEEGCKMHGLDKNQTNDLIKELDYAINFKKHQTVNKKLR